MTKIANAFQVAPTTLWERINSDDPFNPHEVGKPANLSADAMASLTADIERDDHRQRSKTPNEMVMHFIIHYLISFIEVNYITLFV